MAGAGGHTDQSSDSDNQPRDRPDLTIVLLQVGAAVSPPSFHAKRVCIFFDEQTGLVAAVPAVG
jgi:hypothetical protein